MDRKLFNSGADGAAPMVSTKEAEAEATMGFLSMGRSEVSVSGRQRNAKRDR